MMEVDEPTANALEEKKNDYSRPFSLKRWNACAVWTWDVECDTCAICRLQLMEECLRCQADATKGPEKEPPPPVTTRAGRLNRARVSSPLPPPSSTPSSSSTSSGTTASAATVGASSSTATGSGECVVVWGDCSHSFHNCCMAQWVKQNARCPLCQQDWAVARIGK